MNTQTKKSAKRHINWVNTLFLLATTVIGVAGTIYLATTHQIHSATLWLTFFYLMATGLSITVGYHRLYSHNTYKAAWPVHLFVALFGAAAFEGSIMDWSTDHRNHHLYTDTDKDPYNANRGFFYSHIGWLLTLDTSKRDFSNVEDLAESRLTRLQHRFFGIFALVMGIIAPTLFAGFLWGDWLGGFIVAACLRIFLVHNSTFFINSLAHIMGSQPYSNKSTARNNWIIAFLTYGEGYHNYHHQFPNDYRNAIRFYQYDPSKWLIFILSKVGLVSGLKRMQKPVIIRYQMRMEEQILHKSLITNANDTVSDHLGHILQPAKDALHDALKKIEELEKSYKQFKSEQLMNVSGKLNEYRQTMSSYRRNIRHARRELRSSLLQWSKALQNGYHLTAAA